MRRTKLQVAAKYGAFYGLGLVLVMLLLYIAGLDQRSFLGAAIKYVFLITFIVLGTKSHRNEDHGGFLSFRGAWVTGVLISLLGSFITSVYTSILLNFMDPELLGKMLEEMHEQLLTTGLPEADIDLAMTRMQGMFTPLGLLFSGLLGGLIEGCLVSLFSAAFLKRDPNPFQTNL